MSLPPITIPALSDAGAVDPDNDYVLIRQGLNDRKITPANLGNIRMGNLNLLPEQAIQSDLMLIARLENGVYENYAIPPQNIGFLNGTNAWFYNNSAPLGWTIVPNSGDRILATALPGGASYTYNEVGLKGNWLQKDHTLTIDQIPAHTHELTIYRSDIASQDSNKIAGSNRSTNKKASTALTGGSAGHNHGDLWRPLAVVGVLCSKNLTIGA